MTPKIVQTILNELTKHFIPHHYHHHYGTPNPQIITPSHYYISVWPDTILTTNNDVIIITPQTTTYRDRHTNTNHPISNSNPQLLQRIIQLAQCQLNP